MTREAEARKLIEVIRSLMPQFRVTSEGLEFSDGDRRAVVPLSEGRKIISSKKIV